MDYKLTNEEMSWLDTVRVSVDTLALEAPVWRSKPHLRRGAEALPLEHEAAAESFLVAEMEGRVRLSARTRRLEERRLAKKLKPRKPYSLGRKKHWKVKAATKKRQQAKAWDKDPLTRIRHTFRQGVDITEQEWQRLIEPVWRSHPTGSLRLRQVGSGRLNVYNLTLASEGGGASPLYYGPDQAILDSMDSAYSQRVLELTRSTVG